MSRHHAEDLRRDVSDAGKAVRNVMLGVAKTCAKFNVSFYRFLGDRFDVPGAGEC